MKTLDEKARDNAFRQWFYSWKVNTSHSDADTCKWEEAFKAGWSAKTAKEA